MPHTRPTTDIAKEGLFNILQNRIDFEGIKCLDLFGGTGAISLELASRGAEAFTIVEKDPVMASFIKKNFSDFGVEGLRLLQMDVFHFLRTCRETFDFIFAGPPYALGFIDDLPAAIVNNGLIAADGYFVLEHTPRNAYAGHAGFVFQRNYGTTVFSFFQASE